MMKSLFIMADSLSPSFCFYPSPSGAGDFEQISPDFLNRALDFAEKNSLAFTLLLGASPLDPAAENLLTDIPHARILPYGIMNPRPEDLLVLNLDQVANSAAMDAGQARNLILRVGREGLGELADTVKSLTDGYRRLNLHLLDQALYGDEEILTYREQLSLLGEWLSKEYRRGNPLELSCLSDRIMLGEMNNCGAGIDHITLAPNGRFYICPGFFHDDPEDSIGNLDNGIEIPNAQLYELEFAPVCRICDAYQCKRCIWLNRKSTLEVNTPSYQQCTVSHLERDQSRRLLEELRDLEEFSAFPGIKELDYLDPLTVLRTRGVKHVKPEPVDPPVKQDSLDTLPPLGELRPAAWDKTDDKESSRKKSYAGDDSNGNDTEITAVLREILAIQKKILSRLEKS